MDLICLLISFSFDLGFLSAVALLNWLSNEYVFETFVTDEIDIIDKAQVQFLRILFLISTMSVAGLITVVDLWRTGRKLLNG